MEQKVRKQTTVIDELKNLLQMAVKSDQRKDALLQETKVAFTAERDKIASRIQEVDTEKSTLDEYKKVIRQENLDLIEKLDRLEYSNRELQSKVKSQDEFLAKREVDYEELARENEKNRKTLRACEFELEKIRETNDTSQKTYQKDMGQLKIENEDLNELLKTKERMLEDQLS